MRFNYLKWLTYRAERMCERGLVSCSQYTFHQWCPTKTFHRFLRWLQYDGTLEKNRKVLFK